MKGKGFMDLGKICAMVEKLAYSCDVASENFLHLSDLSAGTQDSGGNARVYSGKNTILHHPVYGGGEDAVSTLVKLAGVT